MADLFDRIFGGNPDNEYSNDEDEIGVHDLTATIELIEAGAFTFTAAANYWNLDVAAQADLQALVDTLTTKTTDGQKAKFLRLIESTGIAAHKGIITTKAQYKTILGI